MDAGADAGNERAFARSRESKARASRPRFGGPSPHADHARSGEVFAVPRPPRDVAVRHVRLRAPRSRPVEGRRANNALPPMAIAVASPARRRRRGKRRRRPASGRSRGGGRRRGRILGGERRRRRPGPRPGRARAERGVRQPLTVRRRRHRQHRSTPRALLRVHRPRRRRRRARPRRGPHLRAFFPPPRRRARHTRVALRRLQLPFGLRRRPVPQTENRRELRRRSGFRPAKGLSIRARRSHRTHRPRHLFRHVAPPAQRSQDVVPASLRSRQRVARRPPSRRRHRAAREAGIFVLGRGRTRPSAATGD